MMRHDRTAILEVVVRSIAWRIFGTAGYGRRRGRIMTEEFDRELRTALKDWTAVQRNLKERKEQ